MVTSDWNSEWIVPDDWLIPRGPKHISEWDWFDYLTEGIRRYGELVAVLDGYNSWWAIDVLGG